MKFTTVPEEVDAYQYKGDGMNPTPIGTVEYFASDPGQLVGLPEAHMGHQRALADVRGSVYIYTSNGWQFVEPDWWIVVGEHGVSVRTDKFFRDHFQAVDEVKP
jgi:hypothetical protein